MPATPLNASTPSPRHAIPSHPDRGPSAPAPSTIFPRAANSSGQGERPTSLLVGKVFEEARDRFRGRAGDAAGGLEPSSTEAEPDLMELDILGALNEEGISPDDFADIERDLDGSEMFGCDEAPNARADGVSRQPNRDEGAIAEIAPRGRGSLGSELEEQILSAFRSGKSVKEVEQTIAAQGLRVCRTTLYQRRKLALAFQHAGRIQQKILANPTASLLELRRMLRKDGLRIDAVTILEARRKLEPVAQISERPHTSGVERPRVGGSDAASPRVQDIADYLARPGAWRNDAGDYAPHAIANALGREVLIHNYPAGSGRSLRVPPMPTRTTVPGSPIKIFYAGGHYESYVRGQRVPVLGDGDCLFRAVLMNLHQTREVANEAVLDLRRRAAQDIRDHPADFQNFVG